MHVIQPYRPLQAGLNHRVMEQNRRFFFVVSATLGIDLCSGKARLDVDFLKDAFEAMADNPTPEMGMPKPRGEFLVTGAFFAPGGRAVTGGEVRVRLGQSEKSLYVFGPRRWKTGGLPSSPEPITTLPVDYAHAFGGLDYPKNPDGMGYKDGRLPCIENPDRLITSAGDAPDPAGIAPLVLDCPQRMRFRGTYEDDYKLKYYPGYPEDMDWRFFLNSPEDQWIQGYFQGSESFEIRNMHPEMPVISGALPDLYARAFIRHTIGTETPDFGELPLNLDTVWFFPGKQLGLLVFRGITEVADDEATQISDVLLAYENRRDEKRSLAHYHQALERRMTGENPFLNYFQTRDLIPPGDPTALAIFQEKGEVELDDNSALSQNITAREDACSKTVADKVDEAARQAEQSMAETRMPDTAAAAMPEDDAFDVQKMIREPADPGSAQVTDPDLDEFTRKLEEIMPGITSGQGGKVDLEDFPFDRIGEIADAAEVMGQKKDEQAREKLREQMTNVRDTLKSQMAETRQSGLEMPDDASDELRELDDQINALEAEQDKTPPPQPLPRVNAEALMEKLPLRLPDEAMAAMAHLQGLKSIGMETEQTRDLEAQLTADMEEAANEIRESLYELEQQFRAGYIMGAHFMEAGLPPHSKPVKAVRAEFLDAVAAGKPVAGGDWACIDLSGARLDQMDLSEAFFEQVNFSGASLKGANLSGAFLVRADLTGADLTGANLQGANIGAADAAGCIFVRADCRSAVLSKGDFTGADFTAANLKEAETLYVRMDQARFSGADVSGIQFLEPDIRGADFTDADLSGSFFLNGRLSDVTFAGAAMTRCLFANMILKNVCFDRAAFNQSCFAGTDAEAVCLEGLSFREANLQQSNFQRMTLQNTDFSGADLENSYFESADLSGADFSGASAKNAQFRSANLTGANLEGINLMGGSLAKARLVRASLARANLFQVDFLRATITDTNFDGSNLDSTLIAHWRPE